MEENRKEPNNPEERKQPPTRLIVTVSAVPKLEVIPSPTLISKPTEDHENLDAPVSTDEAEKKDEESPSVSDQDARNSFIVFLVLLLTFFALSRRQGSANSEPPRLATEILRALMSDDVSEALIGDLSEGLPAVCKKYGRMGGKAWFWRETIRSLGPLGIVLICRLLLSKLNAKLAPSPADGGGPSSAVMYVLYLFLPRQGRSECLGDVEQTYTQVLSRFGLRRARLWVWFEAFNVVWVYRRKTVFGMLMSILFALVAGHLPAIWGLIRQLLGK